jgi:hypothetical protein
LSSGQFSSSLSLSICFQEKRTSDEYDLFSKQGDARWKAGAL